MGNYISALLSTSGAGHFLDEEANVADRSAWKSQTLTDEIRQQHGKDATDAVEFVQLVRKQQACFNVSVYFREQDREFVLQELDRLNIVDRQRMTFNSPFLFLFEIPSLDILKDLPALFELIPLTLSMTKDW
jgi:hypothetical protein